VLGIDPPHGPFVGGTLVTIRGNGFESNTRVWFGDVEVPRELVTPLDPQRIQLNTPPGNAGSVDLRVHRQSAEAAVHDPPRRDGRQSAQRHRWR
jgi:hypothetical protein